MIKHWITTLIAPGLLFLSASCTPVNGVDSGTRKPPADTAQAFYPDATLVRHLPHIRYRERYQKLFLDLKDQGIKQERLLEIFASEKAAAIDHAAIALVSERAARIGKKKSKAQLTAIAESIVSHLHRHRTYYNRLERRFGVNREIAAAILYKETGLGRFSDWRHDAFSALNSVLGFMAIPDDAGKRDKDRLTRIIDSNRQSLAALLLYCARNGIDVLTTDFPSSYAGAIGMPQFLPIYLEYAVSADNADINALPDLDKTADAILSVGNLLQNKFRWPGLMNLSRLKAIDAIAAAYIRYDQKTEDASFCMAKDLDGYPLRRFVDEYRDFPDIAYIAGYCEVLMNYNFSSNYVMDVLQIAYHAHNL